MNRPRINRDEETRDNELLPEYNFMYANPYDLPPGVWRAGYNFHWCRLMIRNEREYRLERLIKEYWEIVPQSRVTSTYNLDPLGLNPLSKDYICVKGEILVERPMKYGEQKALMERKIIQDTTRGLSADINNDYANVRNYY